MFWLHKKAHLDKNKLKKDLETLQRIVDFPNGPELESWYMGIQMGIRSLQAYIGRAEADRKRLFCHKWYYRIFC